MCSDQYRAGWYHTYLCVNAATSSSCWYAGHGVHVSPTPALKRPAGQGPAQEELVMPKAPALPAAHTPEHKEEFRPVVAPNLPTGHCVHPREEGEGLENLPAGQTHWAPSMENDTHTPVPTTVPDPLLPAPVE